MNFRSKELETACSAAALQGVGIQAVVTEFLIKYADLIFSDKLPTFLSSADAGGFYTAHIYLCVCVCTCMCVCMCRVCMLCSCTEAILSDYGNSISVNKVNRRVGDG